MLVLVHEDGGHMHHPGPEVVAQIPGDPLVAAGIRLDRPDRVPEVVRGGQGGRARRDHGEPQRAVVWANGVTNSAAIACAYSTGCALMARTANRSARSLLAWVNAAVSGTNPLVVPCHAQIRWLPNAPGVVNGVAALLRQVPPGPMRWGR